ncbi:fatty acid hydroxylase family protein [Undibacterium sp. JH2W]|uniref:fatty acid hydroxylase family protein n=1 Tax=Undibacterium sp. JH2W TaxID=3413037 RepID=UPI003BF0CFCB
MDDKQRLFRLQYQAAISPYYHGVLHVLFVFGLGFALIAIALVQLQIQGGAGWAWLGVPATLLFANVNEWHVHKNRLHKRGKGRLSQLIWHRHTREHHHYFTHEEMRVASTREYRIVFFPAYAFVMVAVQSVLLGLLCALLGGRNLGYIVFATAIAFYLWYEAVHFLCHVDENALLRHLPLVNTMRRNHMVHHTQALMTEYNMNLTFPFADWLFGTSDLQRSLLGTIFNGYGSQHLKPEVARRYQELGMAPPVPHVQAPLESVSQSVVPADLNKV